MRKQIVLLAKKMTACGLAAAMLFGVGPFDKVTTSKSAAADESYTYLYADLNWAEYWAAEDVYLKEICDMSQQFRHYHRQVVAFPEGVAVRRLIQYQVAHDLGIVGSYLCSCLTYISHQ